MPYHTVKSMKPKQKPKEMTLKQAIEKFDNMKNKPKGNMKSDGKLSTRQKDILKTHKDHHSNLHIRFMKYLMTNKNMCFEIAHSLAKDIIGKQYSNAISWEIKYICYFGYSWVLVYQLPYAFMFQLGIKKSIIILIMDIISKLNNMKKPELLKLARAFNSEFKIKEVHKLKKKDLITELVIRQEQVKEILEGKVTVKPKGKRTKKKKSDDENNKLLLDITKKQKQILKLNADKDGAKISSLRNEISKLTSKLSF